MLKGQPTRKIYTQNFFDVHANPYPHSQTKRIRKQNIGEVQGVPKLDLFGGQQKTHRNKKKQPEHLRQKTGTSFDDDDDIVICNFVFSSSSSSSSSILTLEREGFVKPSK